MKKKRISSEERREIIIEAAMKLFSNKGFNGTTTRDIAKESDICEAMLYKHFNTKESLYTAIIDAGCSHNDGHLLPDEDIEDMNVSSVLEFMAANLIKSISDNISFMRLFLFSALEGHDLGDIFFKKKIMKHFNSLSVYLKTLMDKGLLKKQNPKLAARSFIGMIIYYIMVQEIYGGKRIESFNLDEVVQTFVDIFLNGVKQG
ncbi:MAG: TetR/AcrR family transcriptional regulator [Nitrospirota bacterium]